MSKILADGASLDGAAEAAAGARVLVSLPLGLGLLVYCLGLASQAKRLADPDTMLHVMIGRWVIAHRAVPHADFLTHTVAGGKWVVHEWLGGVVSALFFDTLGWQGLVAMASLGLALSVAIFTRALLRYYGPAQATVIACAAWLVVTPHWLARPHMVALPLLVLWMTLLVAARQENRAPPLAAALLMIPWVNIHGTFLVGIGFAGLFTAEAVLMNSGEAARLKAARAWTVFTLAAVAASLVTPNGIEAYLLPLKLLNMKFALTMLVEWKSANFQHLSALEIWLLLFLATVLLRGIKLPATRALFVLMLVVMSLQHVRNGDLLAFIVPLLAGPWAGPQLASAATGAGGRDWLTQLARPASALGLALAAAVAGAGEAVALRFPLDPIAQYSPVAAVRAMQIAGLPGPVLNDYNYGDYLMFVGIKTFIDGRADLFDDAFVERYYKAAYGQSDDLPAILAEYKIAWTIFPADSRAVAQLDRLAGWHRVYADSTAVVHIRDDAP